MSLTPDTPDLGSAYHIRHFGYATQLRAAQPHTRSASLLSHTRSTESAEPHISKMCEPARPQVLAIGCEAFSPAATGQSWSTVTRQLFTTTNSFFALSDFDLFVSSRAAAAALHCRAPSLLLEGFRRIRCRRLPRTCTPPLRVFFSVHGSWCCGCGHG